MARAPSLYSLTKISIALTLSRFTMIPLTGEDSEAGTGRGAGEVRFEPATNRGQLFASFFPEQRRGRGSSSTKREALKAGDVETRSTLSVSRLRYKLPLATGSTRPRLLRGEHSRLREAKSCAASASRVDEEEAVAARRGRIGNACRRMLAACEIYKPYLLILFELLCFPRSPMLFVYSILGIVRR